MRPAGEIRMALLQAAADMAHIADGRERGPTMQELAARAQVGVKAACTTVKNMTRSGALRVVDKRKVPHRNKPVAEYALPRAETPPDDEYVDVARVFNLWVQR